MKIIVEIMAIWQINGNNKTDNNIFNKNHKIIYLFPQKNSKNNEHIIVKNNIPLHTKLVIYS